VRYWCTPSSLKLKKTKKSQGHNLESICEDLEKRIKRYKFSRIILTYTGQLNSFRKVVSFLKKKKLKKKIIKLKFKLKYSFNGCRLAKRQRKKRRIHVSFYNKKKFNYYQKYFNVYKYNSQLLKFLKINSIVKNNVKK